MEPMEQRRDRPGPAAVYSHSGHAEVCAGEAEEQQLTLGQRVADTVAGIVGGWPFIFIQSGIILAWIAANAYLAYQYKTDPGYFTAWDPYPYILLNLVLSFESAYAGPIIMMSQNRQSENDRLRARHDYQVNVKAEEEIKVIMEHLAHQDGLLLQILERLDKLPPAGERAPDSKD
jgi:Predicted membrane protein